MNDERGEAPPALIRLPHRLAIRARAPDDVRRVHQLEQGRRLHLLARVSPQLQQVPGIPASRQLTAAPPWSRRICPAERLPGRRLITGVTLTRERQARGDPSNASYPLGGDISQLYRAMGEKSPATPIRRRRLIQSASEIGRRVFLAIGGKPTRWEDLAETIEGDDCSRQDAEWSAHQERKLLAQLSIRYAQLREVLERPPTLREFGVGKFIHLAPGP